MTQLNVYQTIFENLNRDTTILTPNRRLSATLHQHYQQYQIDKGILHWETPDILPISTWLERTWNEYCTKHFLSGPELLNDLQGHFLWEQAINATKDRIPLLQITETADIAQSAWSLLKQWLIDIKQEASFQNAEDYSALYEWANYFSRECIEQNWIDRASIADLLIEKIESSALTFKNQFILVGFVEGSPQFKRLFEKQKHILFQPSSKQMADYRRVALPTAEDEIYTMAKWAKQLHEKDNKTTIACVIPSLDKIRDRVMQIFSEVFAPAYALENQESHPFNLSAGKNLLHYPIIHAALQLLALNQPTLPIETFSYLLGTPFLGDAEAERGKRAHWDSLLRQENIHRLNIAQLLKTTHNKRLLPLMEACPKLAKRIQAFLEETNSIPLHLTYQQWAETFNHLLSILGWPGERSLNSEEYQIVDNWLSLLNEFASLDEVAKPITYHEARLALTKIASQKVFQAKTPDAPIQVLGVLEAAALPFDHIWVAGLDDLAWPPQPKPNPFIPKSLQRALNMPHATAERELIYCEQLIQQFKDSAANVIFSHAEKNEELELQASPLIRDLQSLNLQSFALDILPAVSVRIHQTKAIEYLEDAIAPSLLSDEKIQGGISILKQQALCPFKAFAEWRLHAHTLENPIVGLRAKDRGTILHLVLEIIWKKLQHSDALHALSDSALKTLIQDSIEQALPHASHAKTDYKAYLALEQKRLHKLVHEWLTIEKERAPFTVLGSEKAAQMTLNQLTLSIRIDRVDQLANGKKLIIDYKTGKHNDINAWFTERPDDPQLPLYALLDKENSIGITYAQIAPGENYFKGVSRNELDIKGIKPVTDIKKLNIASWEEQLDQWYQILVRLSDDFSSGIAKIDPKDEDQTCLWCDLKPLCRINEEISVPA